MILRGYPFAQMILGELKEKSVPKGKLVVVQVGDNPVSSLYITAKEKVAKNLKINFERKKFAAGITEPKLMAEIEKLNRDRKVSGILIQLPLPASPAGGPVRLDREKIAAAISSQKDIDGFHYILAKASRFIPPTVLAIDGLLDFYRIERLGKKILIVGGGFLVGRPLRRFWREKHEVEILEKGATDYFKKLKEADIVVLATSGGGKFSPDNFKDGATVVDASTVIEDGKLRGDIVSQSWPDNLNLAPVPGGIGPVTVAMLFKNFYQSSFMLSLKR